MTSTAAQRAIHPLRVASHTPSVAPLMASMKSGLARLTATADNTGATRLTEVRHKAPLRLVPIPSSSIHQAGAAVAAISNYGAGLLPGDSTRVDIHAQPRTKLGVITQGANRIYKQQSSSILNGNASSNTTSRSKLQATVDRDALCVIAPDPTVPFATSRFQQTQTVEVHPQASAILVDWFSAGRVRNGERWEMGYLSSHSTLALQGEEGDDDDNYYRILLVDATTLDQRRIHHHNTRSNLNPHAFGFNLGRTLVRRGEEQLMNAYATVILYGHQSKPVIEQLKVLQAQLAANYTRLRTPTDSLTDDYDAASQPEKQSLFDLTSLSGRVLLGLNEVHINTGDRYQQPSNELKQEHPGPLYVARMVASSNEDIYRVLHRSLQPLAADFGFEFYKDRIRASSSPPMSAVASSKVNGTASPNFFASAPIPPKIPEGSSPQSPPVSSWHAYMLADSALPTGSFAHSSGLEAAAQLGLLDNEPARDVSTFVQVATQSTVQQWKPWIVDGHSILSDAVENSERLKEWKKIDRKAHAVLVGSAPACRASIDQGRNLLRVAIQWLKDDAQFTLRDAKVDSEQAQLRQLHLELYQDMEKYMVSCNHHEHPSSGHLGPIFGLVGAALGLSSSESCQLLGYCVARDIVSAAVRLNLIGPMASIGVLSQAQHAADEGIRTSLEHFVDQRSFVGGCAPVLDTIHPCHDLLAVRLFRT